MRFAEAGTYDVQPLDDRTPLEILLAERPSARGQGSPRVLPRLDERPERSAANVRGRSFKLLADVETTAGDARGTLFARGSAPVGTHCS